MAEALPHRISAAVNHASRVLAIQAQEATVPDNGENTNIEETEQAKSPEENAQPEQEAQKNEQPKLYDEDYVKSLRSEAAQYRVKAKELEAKLSEAKTQEDIDAAIKGFADENLAITRRAVAAEHGLPKEFATRLQGSTEEELAADAAALKEFFRQSPQPSDTKPPVSPGGGHDGAGTGDPLPDDPAELARLASPRHQIYK